MQSTIEAYQKLAKFKPNPMQEEFFSHIANEDMNPALLLKAPTGSGKTEAVLIPSLKAERRLFLIFPSRSLVDDQIGRCEKYLRQASKKSDRSYALVVDTGAESVRTVFKNGKELEKGKRHLYDGDVILTTFDKFLYRFFGFGEPKKSYIYPFRIHHSGKRENLFCFDEVHAYDQVAFVNFEHLIKALYKANLDLVVMTATMPDTYRKKLNFLDEIDYTIGEKQLELESWQRQKQKRQHPDKSIKYIAAKPKKVQDEICAYVSRQYESDKRTIVTIETIEDLVPVYQHMKKRNNTENIFLYHGRLSDPRRKWVYSKLKGFEDKNEGYLLFTTSAIEVGCDLDAHLLITEVCNPDSLIQRAGRCNRKGKIVDAQIVVVGDKIRPFLSDISEEDEEKYINILQMQQNNRFVPNEILDIMKYEAHSDYRAEVLFDMLYEYLYEARLENKPLHDRGLVITRSFEPSITITTKVPDESNQRPENAVSVSVRSCIAWSDKDRNKSVNSNFKVYQRFYDEHREEFKFKPLDWGGSIYFKELFVEVPESYFCEELGYVEPPKVFENGGTRGYQQNFVYHITDKNNEAKKIWLHYLKDFEKPQTVDEIQLAPPEPVDTRAQKLAKSFESPPEDGEQLIFFER